MEAAEERAASLRALHIERVTRQQAVEQARREAETQERSRARERERERRAAAAREKKGRRKEKKVRPDEKAHSCFAEWFAVVSCRIVRSGFMYLLGIFLESVLMLPSVRRRSNSPPIALQEGGGDKQDDDEDIDAILAQMRVEEGGQACGSSSLAASAALPWSRDRLQAGCSRRQQAYLLLSRRMCLCELRNKSMSV